MFSQITSSSENIEDVPQSELPPPPCKALIDFNSKFDLALQRLKSKKIENKKLYQRLNNKDFRYTKDENSFKNTKKSMVENKTLKTKAEIKNNKRKEMLEDLEEVARCVYTTFISERRKPMPLYSISERVINNVKFKRRSSNCKSFVLSISLNLFYI